MSLTDQPAAHARFASFSVLLCASLMLLLLFRLSPLFHFSLSLLICRHSGYSTGLYTSPHLVSVRERIAINGIVRFCCFFFPRGQSHVFFCAFALFLLCLCTIVFCIWWLSRHTRVCLSRDLLCFFVSFCSFFFSKKKTTQAVLSVRKCSRAIFGTVGTPSTTQRCALLPLQFLPSIVVFPLLISICTHLSTFLSRSFFPFPFFFATCSVRGVS